MVVPLKSVRAGVNCIFITADELTLLVLILLSREKQIAFLAWALGRGSNATKNATAENLG